MSAIEYRHNFPLEVADVAEVLDASGIRRPTDDLARIECMFAKANRNKTFILPFIYGGGTSIGLST